eukprot:TRINITY_DN54052_c0_g1_i1.p1 TRINITY_DN54052_c0_g1~~TRINITY_DN54052_c0_g1_i1.p1  ORF type:complete len:189 (+),score=33.65 TRINITY_DN54052_c0_g1_i1:26-592(+)
MVFYRTCSTLALLHMGISDNVMCVTDPMVPDQNGRHWDHKILVEVPCAEIWDVMADYVALVKIVFPDTEPWYSSGKAKELGGIVSFKFGNDQIDEQIIILNNETQYLSFVLTQGFNFFHAYRGEWFLKPAPDGNAAHCEFHKGSLFIINPTGPMTVASYDKTIRSELEQVKVHFEGKSCRRPSDGSNM